MEIQMINSERREAREYAFTILFQSKFHPDDMREVLDDFMLEHPDVAQSDYIKDVVLGTVEHIDEIDGKINEFSKGRRVERISLAGLTLIRIAVYEMFYRDDIPPVVSIDEAVTLTKKYDDEQVVPFVNGVLGNIKNSIS